MKKRTKKILFVAWLVCCVALGTLNLILHYNEDKEDDISFTFGDPNNSFVILDSNNYADLVITFESTAIYEPKEYLKDVCWVRALTKLAQIYEDPNITDARMTAGWCNDGYSPVPHAWIEYHHSNNIIRYDPRLDVYLEPHPNDANLLTPVIPKEPKEALKIIYDSNEK